MRILKTKIKNLFVVKQKNNFDKRGMLRETFNKKIFNNKNFVFQYHQKFLFYDILFRQIK